MFPRVIEPGPESRVFESNPEDWPGVFWLDEPEGGFLPNAGTNVAGTGHWFDAYGGLCSDRQAPFGFWCSDANPRSQLPNDFQAACPSPPPPPPPPDIRRHTPETLSLCSKTLSS